MKESCPFSLWTRARRLWNDKVTVLYLHNEACVFREQVLKQSLADIVVHSKKWFLFGNFSNHPLLTVNSAWLQPWLSSRAFRWMSAQATLTFSSLSKPVHATKSSSIPGSVAFLIPPLSSLFFFDGSDCSCCFPFLQSLTYLSFTPRCLPALLLPSVLSMETTLSFTPPS